MHEWRWGTRTAGWLALLVMGASACTSGQGGGGTGGAREARPGTAVEVLLSDSLHLVRARTLVVIGDGSAAQRQGIATARLLREDRDAVRAGIRVVGTVDSADLILVDLQDEGSRASDALRTIASVLRQAAPRRTQVVVLDRPNPLTGARVEGPTPTDTVPATRVGADPADLLSLPLRHGLTIGEMARALGERIAPEVPLAIVPVTGWRRPWWPEQSRLPMTSEPIRALQRATLAPFAAVEGMSVGAVTGEAWRVLAAPWLDPRAVLRLLREREPVGVRFEVESVTSGGRTLPALRLTVVERDRYQPGRTAATLLWALRRVHGESIRVDTTRFDAAFGSARARRALLAGDDPDDVMDEELPAAVAFQRESRRLHLYR